MLTQVELPLDKEFKINNFVCQLVMITFGQECILIQKSASDESFMTIQAIRESLSTARFSTYELPIWGGGGAEESLGVYLWNKQLASAFLPALQIIEVSLRNAIYQSYIKYQEKIIERNFPQAQWNYQKGKIDKKWFDSCFTAANNKEAFRSLEQAKRQLIVETKQASPENLISKLTFGFWVSMVDKKYDGQRATYLTLWPDLRGMVFPNAVDQNTKNPLSINSIGNELKEINKIRNRLSHHEPLWKNNKAYQLGDIVNKVIEHYERCLKVIYWINPSGLKMLDLIDNSRHMAQLCSVYSIWRNKQLPKGLSTLPIQYKTWGELARVDTSQSGSIVTVNAGFVFIKNIDGVIFYGASQNLIGGIGNYTVGDKVKFTPESNGLHRPNATKVSIA